MISFRRGRLRGASCAALVGLIGCAHGDAGAPKPLVVVRAVAPATLDPLLLSGPVASDVGPLLFSYLLTTDPSGKLAPDLAVRVPSLANGDIAPDGRTITYRLRRGVRWHDGTPFGARDVVATYRAVMDRRNAVPSRLGFDQVADIRALGGAAVRVRLRAPFAPFPSYFFAAENYPVLPARVLAKYGALQHTPLDDAPVGTGPYRLRAWRRGELLSLEANPAYFRGAPPIARLDLRFSADPQAAANALRAGDAGALLGIDPLVAQELRGDARFAVSATPVFGVEELLFQTRDPALRDPAVRRRIVEALHLERDVAAASRGLLDTRDANAGLWTWATVPTAAPPASRAALPARLTLAYDGTRVLDRILATTMQDDARHAGLTLVLRGYAPQQFSATADAHGPLASGAYQLALRAEITGADPETSWLLACAQIPPPAGWNFPALVRARGRPRAARGPEHVRPAQAGDRVRRDPAPGRARRAVRAALARALVRRDGRRAGSAGAQPGQRVPGRRAVAARCEFGSTPCAARVGRAKVRPMTALAMIASIMTTTTTTTTLREGPSGSSSP